MRRVAILIVLVFSCHDSSMNMANVHGVPPDVGLRCGSFGEDETAMCVGTDKHTYACVRDNSGGCTHLNDRFDCAEAQVFNRHTTESTTVYVNSP